MSTTPTPYNINGVQGKRWTCKTNEEWRHERANSIGASAVGTILGANPYSTPLAVAEKMRAERRGEFDYTETDAMMEGHAFESGVAYLFERKTGLQIIQSSSAEYLLRRDDIPFMHVSPDRTYWIDINGTKNGKNAEANKGILECKTTRMPIDPDNLPLSWIFQLQVQMGVSGYTQGFLAWDVLSVRNSFDYRFFTFDANIFNSVVDVCRDFWHNCIIEGNNPEPVNNDDIIRLYPTHTPGKTVTASADIQQKLKTLSEMKTTEKELKDEIDSLSNEVKAVFEDAEALVDLDGNVLATYKASKGRSSVDSAKLKEEFPDAYQACLKQSAGSRSLLIK